MIMDKVSFTDVVRKRYESAYGIVGNHSGVQICSWNKKVLRGKGACYKQKFYGVDCHRCAQMSPALAWCQENCIFCWRPMEWMSRIDMKEKEVDAPEEIIEKTVSARKKLISGIGGAEDVNKKLFKECFEKFPSHWAISLSGEPTIYPRIGELISSLRANKEVKSIFLVTNGQEPEKLKEMAEKKQLPTQLYVSLTAPTNDVFKEVNRPVYKDGWERLNKTLSLMADFKCRRVIRLTLIKGVNDNEKYLDEYAELVEKSRTDFLEVKAYMFLGLSRQRLKIGNMPYHEDIKEWSEKLVKKLKNYSIIDEHEPSRIVLFKRNDSKYENIIREV